MKKLVILLSLFSFLSMFNNAYAKSCINVSSYYKIRYVDGKECKEFYTFQNCKEIFVNIVCN